MTAKNILIADQDINNLQYFFSYISGFAHYNIMNAVSAAMALEIKQEKTLDLIIIDLLTVMSSDQNQADFWDKLTDNQTLPLILMTHSTSNMTASGLELDAFVSDTIRKPFNAITLREKMDRLLEIPPLQRMDPVVPSEVEPKNLTSREAVLQRQKEIIDFEKEMMIAERINLHQLREELRKEIIQLEEEKKVLEEEKEDLLKQQAYFTEEENKLFAAQVKLQEDRKKLEAEKKQIVQQKNELEKARQALKLEQEAFLQSKNLQSEKTTLNG